jgi:hypothetical protein
MTKQIVEIARGLGIECTITSSSAGTGMPA